MHLLYLHPLYVDYFAYFNKNQDYFECHEVLEEYWKTLAPGDKSHVLVGLVQLATGMYHWRRGNTTGARRILIKAVRCLQAQAQHELLSVVHTESLQNNLTQALQQLEQGAPFAPFTIRLTNEALQTRVDAKTVPTYTADYLQNKHALRDRSEVLEARAAKIAQKKDKPLF